MTSVWPSMIVSGDLSRATTEWVSSNGAGAYVSSTIAQMATRRYHGLLVAPAGGLEHRYVIVSHVDATLDVNGETFQLATHQFPDVEPTQGYRFIHSFHQDPLPRTTFQVAGGQLEQTLALDPGHSTLAMQHLWTGSSAATLTLRPLLAMRELHGLMHRHGAMRQLVEMRRDQVSVRPVPDLPAVTFLHHGAFVGSPDWWYRFELLVERERGLDFQEDLWTPGLFRFHLDPGKPLLFTCTTEPPESVDVAGIIERARAWHLSADPGPERSTLVRSLSVASQAYRCDRGSPPAIVAGYPWFDAWGRFSVMSLPGLYFVQGDAQQAKVLVRSMLAYMRDGLLPCELVKEPVLDSPRSLDATLRLFPLAVELQRRLRPDDPFVRDQMLPKLERVMQLIRSGQVVGLRVNEDGFLHINDLRELPTWMNVRVNGVAVTPREGAPIELQAAWAEACRSYLVLTEEPSVLRLWVERAREQVRENFAARFWCNETGYPFDYLPETGGHDGACRFVRPNALLALAWAPELFSRVQAQAIVSKVDQLLMTPAGIRTLAPDEPAYRGVNRGTISELDQSYHQGSAWPFLLGAYGTVCRRLYGDEGPWRDALVDAIAGIVENSDALGHIPELADGDFPHRSAGCFGFAPSTAELLRVLVEDLGL